MKEETDEHAEGLVESALSKLGLSFGWEEGCLFILDSEKITGRDLLVRAIVRARSLQLSVPLLQNPSGEQTGVAFWQEWRRRGEATFCMIDEEAGNPEMLLSARLPLEGIGTGELANLLRASLASLARDWQKTQELMKDVQREEDEARA